jgi:hypothetical protein
MDPADYFTLYSVRPVRRAAILATILCLWYLVWLWRKGELYGVQLRVFVLWFGVALAIQFVSRSVWVWIAGFLAQVALAIVLVLKRHWTDSA